jgi:hypothetical protein
VREMPQAAVICENQQLLDSDSGADPRQLRFTVHL